MREAIFLVIILLMLALVAIVALLSVKGFVGWRRYIGKLPGYDPLNNRWTDDKSPAGGRNHTTSQTPRSPGPEGAGDEIVSQSRPTGAKEGSPDIER